MQSFQAGLHPSTSRRLLLRLVPLPQWGRIFSRARLLIISLLLISQSAFAQFGPLIESAPFRSNMPEVSARQQMVAAANPLAAQAGKEMLDAGGSATDAVIAMQLVLSLVEPQSSGIGGGGFALLYDAQKQKLVSLDGRESAPASVTPSLFLGADGKPVPLAEAYQGGRSVGVPGMIKLMARAHKASGRLSWQRLFRPAIRLSRDGFIVTPRLAMMLANADSLMKNVPATRRYFSRADGTLLQAGDRLRNPDYAALLARIAARGPDAFYAGSNARALIKAVADSPVAPAKLTQADLDAYAVIERPPLCGPYRGYRICSMGPPSSGATTILAALALLERFDLKALGPNNADAIHVIAEALAIAFADRERYLADPAFVAVPVTGLLDPAYLASRAALIDVNKAGGPYSAGNPPGADQSAFGLGLSHDIPSTSHMVAVDRRGNMVSWTGTVQAPFGSFLLAGGALLNNELTDFAFTPEKDGKPVANRAEPGKRPRSSMAPLIAFDASGKPVLAVGSAGGSRIIAHVLKALIARLDWGMSVQRAIDYPNVFKTPQGLEMEPGPVLSAVRAGLEAKGHKIIERLNVSGVQAIAREADGSLSGGADPRREGVALGD